MAEKHPQDAFIGLTKSLSFEWLFLQRVVPDCREKFIPLEEALVEKFMPRLFGVEVTLDDRQLFELPVRNARWGISNPTSTAEVVHKTSVQCTKLLMNSICSKGMFEIGARLDCVNTARKVSRKEQQAQQSERFKVLVGRM